MTDGVLNIACYITITANYIKQIAARTAKMTGGEENSVCYMLNIASRTTNIDNYISSDADGRTRKAANVCKTSPDSRNAINFLKSPKGPYKTLLTKLKNL